MIDLQTTITLNNLDWWYNEYRDGGQFEFCWNSDCTAEGDGGTYLDKRYFTTFTKAGYTPYTERMPHTKLPLTRGIIIVVMNYVWLVQHHGRKNVQLIWRENSVKVKDDLIPMSKLSSKKLTPGVDEYWVDRLMCGCENCAKCQSMTTERITTAIEYTKAYEGDFDYMKAMKKLHSDIPDWQPTGRQVIAIEKCMSYTP